MDEKDENESIDDPSEVERLLNTLTRALPFKAKFDKRIWEQLIRDQVLPAGATAAVIVEEVSYSGDAGGIMCKLLIGGSDANKLAYCSLTHLRPDRGLPFYRDIAGYQKRRVKNLKRQEAFA